MIKLLTTSLFRKKARAVLLFISIAFCAALIFSNEGFSKTISTMIYEADTRWGGNSDIYISTWETADAQQSINADDLKTWDSNVEYTYFFNRSDAYYQPQGDKLHCFTAFGVNIDEFLMHNPFSLVEGSYMNDSGYEVILGETYAKQYNMGIGDQIPLEIGGKTNEFTIVGVAKSEGPFLRELADGGYMLIPQRTITDLVGTSNNIAFMKLTDINQLDAIREEMAETLPQYKVEFAANPALITAEVNNYVVPFKAGSIAVILMCSFIIYTSFNLITQERINILGIIRSIGCSRKKANLAMLTESACIGFVSGVIGCVIGAFLLLIFKSTYFKNIDVQLTFDMTSVLLAIGFSVFITIVISLVPILCLTNQSVKMLVLNDFHQKTMSKSKNWIFGVIFCSAALIVSFLMIPNSVGMILGIILVVLSIIGMLMLIPKIGQLLSNLTKNTTVPIMLSIRNVIDFKSLLNNARLIAAVVAIMCMMLSLFGTLTNDLKNSYATLNYDVKLTLRDADEESLMKLQNLNSVQTCIGVQEVAPLLRSQNTFFNSLNGIDGDEFFEYYGIPLDKNTRAAIENLNTERNIITTDLLRLKFDLEIGDELVFEYGGKQFPYTITGFVNTNYGIGHVGFISRQNFMQDTSITDYTSFFIRAEDSIDATQRDIRSTFNNEILRMDTLEELEAANADKVIGILNSISLYILLAVLVGVVGIGNNIMASFVDRRRTLALYRTMGTSLRNTQALLFWEMLWTLVLGIGGGLLAGSLIIRIVPFLVSTLWGLVDVFIPYAKLGLLCGSTVLVMFLAVIATYRKMKKFSIMQNIREK